MGPYCSYCETRCFVRNPRKAGYLLATCASGKAWDKRVNGYCYDDVRDEINPPAAAAAEELTLALVDDDDEPGDDEDQRPGAHGHDSWGAL